MDSSLPGRAESDVYRMDASVDSASFDSSSSGADHEELAQEEQEAEMQSEDLIDLDQLPQPQTHRPPPISTEWGSGEMEEEPEDVEAAASDGGRDDIISSAYARVSFNIPPEGAAEDAADAPRVHFQDPKRQAASHAGPYPTQSLRGGSDAALEEVEEIGGRGKGHKTPLHKAKESLAEVTPAFIRRAAKDLGVSGKGGRGANHLQDPVPPNSLVNRRDRSATNAKDVVHGSTIPESSFAGADAAALDGTFVSIRDLNDDDDVPSVDNDRWNASPAGKGGESDAGFPTESTSLLGEKDKLPWQGGFFGSQMEKEDRKERRKMMRARKGWLSGWAWTIRSLFWSTEQSGVEAGGARGGNWEASHPIGSDFVPRRNAQSAGGSARQRTFSLFLIAALCFHLALCALHDIFLRYLSYRNPVEDGEAEVSWNGEGQYVPALWLSFDGRVLNRFIGPGARTLTAFGALVPGLVLSKGQGWRVVTSLFQTSSLVELLLHSYALKKVVGGPLTGMEWKRGTFITASLYLVCAIIGSAWSIAVEPGHLATSSGMGIAGLLAASMVERRCSPLAPKDDEDEPNNHHNFNGNGSNGVATSSNEQFTYQPPASQKKKRRNPMSGDSAALFLLIEVLASWWADYASIAGTATAAIAGAACGLLLFVGSPPGSFDGNAHQDLLFTETPPPPPRWAGAAVDDDDSEDSSIGYDGKHAFKTPLMRRSILADEDEEEMAAKSTVRRRNVTGYSAKTPSTKGRMTSIQSNKPFSASRVIARVVGVLLALLLTLIPASLIATGEGPSSEMTRASVLGCKPMRIVYKEDDSTDLFECAGGCVPLSRERAARRSEGMRAGRCDAIGYRCFQQTGTITLRNYEVPVGIYAVQTEDGSCSSAGDDGGEQQYENNGDANAETPDAYNGEVEGVQ
ncbi:hypothetical protein ACHAXT_009941 [Thalassiosira profunda]